MITVNKEKLIERAALVASGVAALGTGSFVSISTIFFLTNSYVTATVIGIGLTLSAISGMIASVPIAYFADRLGKLRTFSISYILRAIGMLLWLIVRGNIGFLIFMTLFGIIDRSAASLTRSLIVMPLSKEKASILMGNMALPTNLGYGIGAGISGIISFFSFHRTLLNVYIPLLVAKKIPNLTWIAPTAFVCNTIVIALFQGTTNKFAVQKKAYDLFWIISGFCLVMSFLGIVVSGIFNANNTYLILLVFLIVMQIVAELFSSAALAVYMVEFSRSQYLTLDLSAINLGGQLQNIVGPMIFGESAASNSLAPLSMCVLTLSFTVIELRRILSLCRKK